MKKLSTLVFFVVALQAYGLSIPNQVNSPMALGDHVLDISIVLVNGDGGAFGLRSSYGVTDKIDVEFEGVKTDLSYIGLDIGLGLSYQWLGESVYKIKQNNVNSTARLKFFRGESQEDYIIAQHSSGDVSDGVKTRIKSPIGVSFSNSFGYVLREWISIYGGGQIAYVFVRHEMKIGSEPEERTDNHIWRYGPFGGILFSLVGSGTVDSFWKIVFAIEGSFMNTPISSLLYKGKERHWLPITSGSLSILFAF